MPHYIYSYHPSHYMISVKIVLLANSLKRQHPVFFLHLLPVPVFLPESLVCLALHQVHHFILRASLPVPSRGEPVLLERQYQCLRGLPVHLHFSVRGNLA